jgi:predicted O-methyltransferase YrrM
MTDSAVPEMTLKRRLRRLRRVVRGSIDTALHAVRGRGSVNETLATMPLMFADKTYNTAHPAYEPELARCYSGRIHNPDLACSNPLFVDIRNRARRGRLPNRAWRQVLREVMAEAATVPGFDQVMERKAYVERYLADLEQRYQSHFVPGWVNLIDAQFLYWVVRRIKPKTIVQTGVSNGLSSAFMMLALAKNGPEGRLHVIDLPYVFDPADPAWTRRGTVYGVVIPEGKSSGWLVPDIYRDRFEVQTGDAKALLPPLIDRLEGIDMFFHDSDHTYHHMMFEFEQAMRKLAPHGVIVADDISWNESLWDFADKHRLPGYNYRATLGVAFLTGSRGALHGAPGSERPRQ